ncbi:GNAT family N-acetyltransferase [Kribbella sandramycini]|uniref:GNAT family N-acetyltransferase n=1 Tax=Kribbella sandramycini TaxID=60450 RepID=A0A7Y4L5V4_9ACTN|nr:GNAT family N-acetyltransferase [Kribbella sandramycini]MBB6565942.1 ribosomal protein S18 acetylase RimI-like enzyme [Kribbella sandramycini]NOL44948.1 GNAT family N-acetyltransferase [Kribbella sandramycini]
MELRPYRPDDLDELIALTIETFGPFYEQSYRPVVGELIFTNTHGEWRDDYHRHVATLHNPDENRYAAVAEDGGALVGYVAWDFDPAKRHGGIDILATASTHRRQGLAKSLCEHAFAHLKAQGIETVEIGTGGDPFHEPARALYESLGCTPFPTTRYYREL